MTLAGKCICSCVIFFFTRALAVVETYGGAGKNGCESLLLNQTALSTKCFFSVRAFLQNDTLRAPDDSKLEEKRGGGFSPLLTFTRL